MIKVEKPIAVGVYTFCNIGSVLVYRIEDDRVLAGINDEAPKWCKIKDVYSEELEDVEPGFFLGSLFIPFCNVMRIGGQARDRQQN